MSFATGSERIYIFFYGQNNSYGYMSNFYEAKFIDLYAEFKHVEQYMHYKKALLFNDKDTADKIIKNPSASYAKKMGRSVKNFDEKVWSEHKIDIVEKGLYLKFSQNDDLKNQLLSTGSKILVEASPIDRIWGIGRSISAATEDVKNNKMSSWGQNLLGLSLMKIRKTLE